MRFSRFGAPRAIVSDRGANFCSKLIQALCELFEVQRYHTSSYHPTTNSTCERMNRTIAQTLRTLVAKDQSNWHKLIPSVMMALRMSTNTESTGYSPFQMLFGKEMNLPFDISVQPKDEIIGTIPDIQRNVSENNRNRVDDIDDIQNDIIDGTQTDAQIQQNDAQMQQNGALLQQNDETNDDDNDFIAEKLLAKKRRQGKNYYKVKWVGYKKTTWEPEENIGEGLLVEFYTKFTKSGTKRKRPTSLLVKQTN
ncbi:Hypothetical predicted protein [Mytilus galloprovincialis]|uniref:Chromo domain-containing protein n=1 Tax=Mytilus galloprovincialis TaxID=29158 RepID=A0A8B6GLA4_MYTGA|nr:Hypothetical predicted protein [Mytilus galloprovincialis]